MCSDVSHAAASNIDLIYLLTGSPALTQAIEVLLKKKAYFVKRLGKGAPEGSAIGQLTWSLNGGAAAAWETAKQKAYYAQCC